MLRLLTMNVGGGSNSDSIQTCEAAMVDLEQADKINALIKL